MDVKAIDLEDIEGVQVRRDASMDRFTTIGTGGRASYLVEVTTEEALAEVMGKLRQEGVDVSETFVLGGGTNLLVADEGFDGVVLRLMGTFADVSADGNLVTAGAAVTLAQLLVFTGERGLSGLEFTAGIPGTVGGAVYMNAGAWGKSVWDLMEFAAGVDARGRPVEISAADHEYSYREGNLPAGFIVTRAVFSLRPADPEEVGRRAENVQGRRRVIGEDETQTFGSVFRNPEGDYAGRLLESVGVKGLEHGGAMVSRDHANFIANRGTASSRDILELMKIMRRRVRDEHGVLLVPEVVLLGFGEDALEEE